MHLANGLCSTHDKRVRKYGTTELPPRPTALERFMARVDKTPTCWLWTGGRRGDYGHFWLDGRGILAHHFLLPAPVPAGRQADHLCRNTLCVRPEHIEVVTPGENTRRQRRHTDRTECVNGHPFTPENRGASRRCLACHRERERRRRAAA